MRVSEAKELFRSLVKEYFAGATVIWAQQSRMTKPKPALVTIRCGNVHRPLYPNYSVVNEELIGYYESRMSITIDVFTHGAAVINDSNGRTAGIDNTSMNDLLSFMDYLNSQYVTEWSHKHDISILLDSDPQDITGLINDTTYEYRARLTLSLYFTQTVVGHAAVMNENSIQYYIDGGMAPKLPDETESSTEKKKAPPQTIVPSFGQTSTGGGTDELTDENTGYFIEAEITDKTPSTPDTISGENKE